MSEISEQIKELREYVSTYETQPFGREVKGTVRVLSEAADTIESLSANLDAANGERAANNGKWILCKDRLPTEEECERDDGRFILDDGNRRYCGLFDYGRQIFTFYSPWIGITEDKCAIAWQPLPEAYHE